MTPICCQLNPQSMSNRKRTKELLLAGASITDDLIMFSKNYEMDNYFRKMKIAIILLHAKKKTLTNDIIRSLIVDFL